VDIDSHTRQPAALLQQEKGTQADARRGSAAEDAAPSQHDQAHAQSVQRRGRVTAWTSQKQPIAALR
jgi:hypothetical protein